MATTKTMAQRTVKEIKEEMMITATTIKVTKT